MWKAQRRHIEVGAKRRFRRAEGVGQTCRPMWEVFSIHSQLALSGRSQLCDQGLSVDRLFASRHLTWWDYRGEILSA